MASIVGPSEGRISRPDHQMSCARAYFVIATGTAVGLDRSDRRDGTHLVLVAVRPGLHPERRRRRR